MEETNLKLCDSGEKFYINIKKEKRDDLEENDVNKDTDYFENQENGGERSVDYDEEFSEGEEEEEEETNDENEEEGTEANEDGFGDERDEEMNIDTDEDGDECVIKDSNDKDEPGNTTLDADEDSDNGGGEDSNVEVVYTSETDKESLNDILVEEEQACQICGKIYQSLEYFQIHQRLHREGKLNKQKTLGPSSSGQTNHESKPVSASRSEESTSQRNGTYVHATAQTDSDKKCTSSLREGGADLLVEGPRVCKFCGKTFYSMDYYRIHQRVHVSEKLKHTPLRSSSKVGTNNGGKFLSARSEDHQVISVYPQMGVLNVTPSPMNNTKMPLAKKCCVCDVCYLTFPNYKSLSLHKKVHRKGLCTVYPLYICSVCNRGFVSKSSFLSHCEFHDAKPWTCSVCGMKFSKKVYLTMHKTSKHKQKKFDYKCSDCGQMFEHQRNLRRHMKTHADTGEGKLQISCLCRICGKLLPLQTTKDLRVHMGIHFGEILQCHLCPEIFRETDEFKEHMDRHLGL